MAGNDDPTKPLPAVDPPEPSGQPGAAAGAADLPTEPYVPRAAADPLDEVGPTDPVIAPHVPVADVRTAQLDAAAPPPPARTGSNRLLIGLIIGAVLLAALILGLAFFGPMLARTADPTPSPTSTPVPTPTTTPTEDSDGPSEEPAPPPPPAPVDPAPSPEPTQPVEPTEPPVDPTPAPTP